ncbi:hypothetical protein D3C78_1663980 [compost metagenome]
MIARQVGEDFHDVFGNRVTHFEQGFDETGFAHQGAEIVAFDDDSDCLGRIPHGAEQKVFTDRRLAVVALQFKGCDEAAQIFLLQFGPQDMPQLHDAGGKMQVGQRIDRRTQRKFQNIL